MLSEAMGITIENTMITQCLSLVLYSFIFSFSRPEKMSVAAGNKNHLIRLIAVVLTGILAGLSGMVLALILHAIQHLAFGYSYGQIVGSVSFLQGVTESSWPRRIVAIVAGGAVAGFGWWLLGRYGQRRVSIAAAVANPCAPMPAGTTTIHALLQIVTVALGSPLGREVAPRKWARWGRGWWRVSCACWKMKPAR